VVAAPEPHVLLAETPDGALALRWKKLILATGARELFLPFPGWTRPEVVGLGGLQALVKSGWPVRGQRVVVAGTGPLLLAVAAEMRRQRASVKAIVEQASWGSLFGFATAVAGHVSKLAQGATLGRYLLRIPYCVGWWPVAAHGRERLEHVVLSNGSRTRRLECDLLACAFGLIPNDELPRLLGATCTQGRVVVDDLQRTSSSDTYAAGELTGVAGVEAAVVEGCIAGLAVAGELERARTHFARRQAWRRFQDRMARAFQLRDELKNLAADDTVICRCEDVTFGQLKQQADWREAKLQCRCGMGNCQGRTCGEALRFLLDWEPAGVRPPVLPTRVETLSTPLP